MLKKKISWSTVVFWLGILIIILWIIAKLFRIVESPVWFEMVPYIGGAATLVGGGIKTGRALQKLDGVVGDVKDIKNELANVNDKVIDI